MANTFKSSVSRNIGTTAVSTYTVPASTTATIIGCSVANTTGSQIAVSVYISRSGLDYYLIKTTDVPPGSSFVVVGGEQKIVMQTGDILKVLSSAASSADSVTSYLEIT